MDAAENSFMHVGKGSAESNPLPLGGVTNERMGLKPIQYIALACGKFGAL
jgi:hypothetical protein